MADPAHAIEKAIFALQQIALAHPGADEHSRAMYRLADDTRTDLLKTITQKDND